MGRSAAPDRSARPRGCSGARPQTSSGRQPAVELRVGEKCAGLRQELVGPVQFLDLAFQVFDPLCFGKAHARPSARVNLSLLDPIQQRLHHTADLRGDRLDRRLQRWIDTPRAAPAPVARPTRGPQISTCSTSSWLHLLKRWSLRETRSGSAMQRSVVSLSVQIVGHEPEFQHHEQPDQFAIVRCMFTPMQGNSLINEGISE